jgi:FixJ family two-component response regulator
MTAATPHPASPSSGCIGIVDDDEDIRRALRRLLIASGFSVRAYASGEAFLESHDAPDCLVLDVHLGGMTGLELYEQLRNTGAVPPVVFITAHHELSDSIERLGALCLWKPFDGQALLSAIDTARREAAQRPAPGA